MTNEFKQSTLTETIVSQVNTLEEKGLLDIPTDYSIPNAINAFYYLIKEQIKDKNFKPAIEVCTRESIEYAARKMVIEGLNPAKKQCYFMIAIGKLEMLPSYFGDIAKAERYGDIQYKPVSNIVYEGDEFETEINIKTGQETLKKHIRCSGRELSKIKGAYAMTTENNGRIWFEYMDLASIKRAWVQGLKLMKKSSSTVQEKFTDRACKRTVIRRLCNDIYNTSSDYSILAPSYAEANTINIDSIQEQIIELPEQKEVTEENKQAPEGVETKAPETKKQDIEVSEDFN